LSADLSPIFCCSFKWVGESKVHSTALWDFPEYAKHPFNDKRVCQTILDAMNKSDACVAHFGDGFDYPFWKSRLLVNGLGVPPPIKTIDTWKLAKNNLKLTGNRLKGIAKFLKLKEQKGDSGGWETWLEVMNGNKAAQRKMVKYCNQDVRTLEGVFLALRPYLNGGPNWSSFLNKQCCPVCGSNHLIHQGNIITLTGKVKRMQCKDCGSWSKMRTMANGKTVLTHATVSASTFTRNKGRS